MRSEFPMLTFRANCESLNKLAWDLLKQNGANFVFVLWDKEEANLRLRPVEESSERLDRTQLVDVVRLLDRTEKLTAGGYVCLRKTKRVLGLPETTRLTGIWDDINGELRFTVLRNAA